MRMDYGARNQFDGMVRANDFAQIDEITTQITALVGESETTLTDIYGIGDLLAAEILAEIGDPTRFATKDKFAMANGTAPLETSSGRVVRHRLNRGGNRQLNRAIHTATTQISRPAPKEEPTTNENSPPAKANQKPSEHSNAASQTASGPTSKYPNPPTFWHWSSPRLPVAQAAWIWRPSANARSANRSDKVQVRGGRPPPANLKSVVVQGWVDSLKYPVIRAFLTTQTGDLLPLASEPFCRDEKRSFIGLSAGCRDVLPIP